MIDPKILSLHMMLLNDPDRMRAYRQAVFNTVQTGDVVLDVGTGSGILAMFACQAGARQVYAVDSGDIIVVARELAKANGFADRIVFLNNNIKHIRLNEKVDVITSELIAKSVLGQDMAELIGFCRDKFLKPSGKILPKRVELRIAPVENEKNYHESRPPAPSMYDISFNFLELLSTNKPLSSRIPENALLAEGQTAYSYQALTAEHSDTFDATLRFNPERAGTLHGFAGWFTTILSEGVELNNKPPGILSWDNLFFPLAKSVEVGPGMNIEIHFRGKSDSQIQDFWVWNTTVRNEDQVIASHRQSSFAGRILSPDAIRKASDSWAPAASLDGRIAQTALGLMNQSLNLREIAERIQREFSGYFETIEDALGRVRKIAEQYGD